MFCGLCILERSSGGTKTIQAHAYDFDTYTKLLISSTTVPFMVLGNYIGLTFYWQLDEIKKLTSKVYMQRISKSNFVNKT